jgi:hypothetical protein
MSNSAFFKSCSSLSNPNDLSNALSLIFFANWSIIIIASANNVITRDRPPVTDAHVTFAAPATSPSCAGIILIMVINFESDARRCLRPTPAIAIPIDFITPKSRYEFLVSLSILSANDL